MSLYEYQVQNMIDEAQKKTAREIRELREAFTEMTKAVKALADEVRDLRADMNPQLDKPKKLPAPAQGA